MRLRSTHLRGLHLVGVLLPYVPLRGTYPVGLHLPGVYLPGMHAMGVHLTGVHLPGVYVMGVSLRACILEVASYRYVGHRRVSFYTYTL